MKLITAAITFLVTMAAVAFISVGLASVWLVAAGAVFIEDLKR